MKLPKKKKNSIGIDVGVSKTLSLTEQCYARILWLTENDGNSGNGYRKPMLFFSPKRQKLKQPSGCLNKFNLPEKHWKQKTGNLVDVRLLLTKTTMLLRQFSYSFNENKYLSNGKNKAINGLQTINEQEKFTISSRKLFHSRDVSEGVRGCSCMTPLPRFELVR